MTPGSHRDAAHFDALLAAGKSGEAEALLRSFGPRFAQDERLAFDTLYVLVTHGRIAEARAQWNRLAASLQESLRVGEDPDRQRRLGEALFAQGLLTARDGDKAEALKLLQQADGHGFPPLDSPLMVMAGDTLRDLQEYELAVSAYPAFLQQQRAHLAARLGLATSLYAARQFADARAELLELLRLAPRTPRANYLVGAVLFEETRYDDARQYLQRELALDARCIPCLSRLAHIAYLDGDDRTSESLLAKARAIDPEDLEAEMVSGLLAFRAGRYPQAIHHLTRVVERAPAYSIAHYQLAMAHRRAGDPEKAREHFEAYQRLLQDRRAREIGFRGDR